MARPGVTFEEVSEAANKLIDQGKKPTIEQIRLILGTGSSTTIAHHLRDWRDVQSGNTPSARETVPDEINDIIKTLWGRLVAHSEDKIKTISAEYQAAFLTIQDDLDKYRHNNQRWQHLYQQWNKEKDRLLEEKRAHEKQIADIKHELDAAQTQYVLSRQQLNEKQDRIQELRVMQQQSQKNLENFQITMQEQRQAEQQQFATQRQEAQAEISNLREQLEALRQATAAMQSQYHKMESKHELLLVECASAVKNLRSREKELNDSEKARVTQMHSAKHWQTQYKDAKQAMEEKNNLYYQSQAEVKALQEKLARLKESYEELDESNKQLNLEKIELIRQKIELEKMLKR